VDCHGIGVEQGLGQGSDLAFVIDGEAQESAPRLARAHDAAPASDCFGYASQHTFLVILAVRPNAQDKVFREGFPGHSESGGIRAAVGKRVQHFDQVSTDGSEAIRLALLMHYSANATHSVWSSIERGC